MVVQQWVVDAEESQLVHPGCVHAGVVGAENVFQMGEHPLALDIGGRAGEETHVHLRVIYTGYNSHECPKPSSIAGWLACYTIGWPGQMLGSAPTPNSTWLDQLVRKWPLLAAPNRGHKCSLSGESQQLLVVFLPPLTYSSQSFHASVKITSKLIKLNHNVSVSL